MTKINELKTDATVTWCPGCTNFAIMAALQQILIELEEDRVLERNNVVLASGIGCHAKIVDYIKVNSFHSIHGRVPPTISGIKLANSELTVIGHAGDGDAYGEGLCHLIFAAKRNTDVNFIVHNNRVYALTTGQFTPTSPVGFEGPSTPRGSLENPLNPIELMLCAGATFVARGLSTNVKHLGGLLRSAVKHQGFSFIDVLQPCVSFFDNREEYKKHTYDLAEENHDPSDWQKAMERAREWGYGQGERIPIGIFYQVKKPTFEERLLGSKILVKTKPKDIGAVLARHI
jgi:2-oxoglutarate ferredoxin oxidoreductase subunit beta